jgi:hypothetical protein
MLAQNSKDTTMNDNAAWPFQPKWHPLHFQESPEVGSI